MAYITLSDAAEGHDVQLSVDGSSGSDGADYKCTPRTMSVLLNPYITFDGNARERAGLRVPLWRRERQFSSTYRLIALPDGKLD